LSGQRIEPPQSADHLPTREALEWHGDEVFLG